MRNKKGLTLVEVVVAMALLAIIIPTVLYALETALKINIVSEEYTDANYLAQTEMENIYNLSSSNGIVEVFEINLGYTLCCTNYCKPDDINGVDYLIVIEEHPEVPGVQMVQLTVSNADGDRAQMELFLRFGD